MGIDDNQVSRAAVLARVRAALGRAGSDGEAHEIAREYLARHSQGPRPSLPPDLVRRFLERASDMSSTVERVADVADVPAAVAKYVATIPAADALPAAAGDGADAHADVPANAAAGVCWPEFSSLGWSEAGLTVESRPTAGYDALGITGCYCAIAETGTLVFVTGIESPSATFLLPETHIAVVRAGQVVPAMEDAFARIRGEYGRLPRAVNLVSGPSRTGDIEQTIVLGAHGPRRLHILVVG